MTTLFHTQERKDRHAALIAQWQSHKDPKALESLMADYTPLFRSQIAGMLRDRALSYDHDSDLMQECAFAFLRAIEGYDPQKCPALAPYLLRHVKGAMRRYMLDFRAACRLGTSSDDRKAYYAAQRLRVQRLTQGQETSVDGDIATIANDSATSLKTARRAFMATSARSVPLDSLEIEDEANSSDRDVLNRHALSTAMAAFERHAATLPERTRTIVCETLLGHRVEGAVARMSERYDLTPRRVRQIQSEGL